VNERGVEVEYVDFAGDLQQVPESAVRRVSDVVGAPSEGQPKSPVIVHAGQRLDIRGEVALEFGGTLSMAGPSVPDLPLGYHVLTEPDGGQRDLIVSPGQCFLPAGRSWGWAVQLYAARSRTSWGIGNLSDLATLGSWARGVGAGFVMVNPLHAAAMSAPQQPSPYSPSSRQFRNPLYLAVEQIPGSEVVDIASAARAGRALNDQPRVDRDAVWRIMRPVLESIFAATRTTDSEFSRWRVGQGDTLQRYATWCAIADEHGSRWPDWPAPLRDPDSAAVVRYRDTAAETVAFHAWLQWQLSRQLDAAAQSLPIIQDLPIGVDPQGADAWAWQDVLTFGASVGAPPDLLNTEGQNWGLAPFVPWRLRAAGYKPFIDSIRSTIGTGGLRIDHVMGLSRLWWVPTDASADHGAYVRYPMQDLLDIVALESTRAEAVVVGEDLGTVEDDMREAMTATGILSYRLLYFEEDLPARWPTRAMGAITTHDLPTVAGLWSGADLRELQQLGLPDAEVGDSELRDRLSTRANLRPAAGEYEAIEAAYNALADAPCLLLTATLDDAYSAPARPNIPNAADRENWSIPLPSYIEDAAQLPGVAAITEALNRATTPVTSETTQS
jgi:4-alpha-glucanotransferase